MNDASAPAVTDPATPRGLLGVLRSWLRSAWVDEAPAAAAPAVCRAGPLRVLVADDDPFYRLWAAARLRELGHEPILAADGAEAVALACELTFDLVLMDLQMPVLDGLKATAVIRRFERENARSAVPMLAFSGACPTASILARHGLNGSLRKPCSEAEFESCLRRWCPGQPSALADRPRASLGRIALPLRRP